jgi:hypothetical protein
MKIKCELFRNFGQEMQATKVPSYRGTEHITKFLVFSKFPVFFLAFTATIPDTFATPTVLEWSVVGTL